MVVGLLPGFGSAAYKGVLLSTNAQPGWKDARWMGGYLTNSALLMGCAELLVVCALMGQTQATAILRTAFIVLLVLNVIPLGLLFANLRPAHALLYTREQQWRVGVLIAAGALIPLGLMLLKGDLLFILVAVIVLLAESWLIRFVYVKIPHTSPLEAPKRRIVQGDRDGQLRAGAPHPVSWRLLSPSRRKTVWSAGISVKLCNDVGGRPCDLQFFDPLRCANADVLAERVAAKA